MIKILLFAIYFSVFHSNVSFAYLDPGTGSIILQTIMALFAAGIATISIWWQKFKYLLNKIFKKKKIDK
tara:strand:+ start:885 stop:1091 length:207 start_codon:yes stop_codon:yes gene_type:complete